MAMNNVILGETPGILIEIISFHPLAHEAIRAVIKKYDGQLGFCRSNSTAEGPGDTQETRLVIIDLCILPNEGREIIKAAKRKYPDGKFLALLQPEPGYEKRIISLLYMGIENFVLLDGTCIDELPKAMQATIVGEVSVPPLILHKYIQQIPHVLATQNKTNLLTPREHQILSLLLQKCSNKEIAAALSIS